MAAVLMKSTRPYHFLLPALAVALACACALFAVGLGQTWREHRAFAEREALAKAELARLQQENAEKQAYLTALLNDPAMMERAARERLGYSREGELIFKFAE